MATAKPFGFKGKPGVSIRNRNRRPGSRVPPLSRSRPSWGCRARRAVLDRPACQLDHARDRSGAPFVMLDRSQRDSERFPGLGLGKAEAEAPCSDILGLPGHMLSSHLRCTSARLSDANGARWAGAGRLQPRRPQPSSILSRRNCGVAAPRPWRLAHHEAPAVLIVRAPCAALARRQAPRGPIVWSAGSQPRLAPCWPR
jgi:hypothetical protein